MNKLRDNFVEEDLFTHVGLIIYYIKGIIGDLFTHNFDALKVLLLAATTVFK